MRPLSTESQQPRELNLYEKVAGKIERLIEEGVLRPGERIPSVRKVCLQHHVSLATANQAYFLLENKGLIESRPRSGFYVRSGLKRLPPEPKRTNPPLTATPVNVDELVSKVFEAAREPEIAPFGAACPSSEILPTAKLGRITADMVRRYPSQAVEYDFPPGNDSLRRCIARRSMDWSGSLSPDDIVITNGCMEAINLCLRAVAGPGDTIALESPSYYGVLQTIESLGMKVLEIPTSPIEGLCLDALKRTLETQDIRACLATPNFNNPLGGCMPDGNKQRLVELLAKHHVPLIEDDIYGDLHFGTDRPTTAKTYDQQGMVLQCSSFSKSLAPGYRVGWTVPGKFKTQIERLKFMTSVATATLPQMVVAEFLNSGGYDRHLRQIRNAFACQVQSMTRAVCTHFPEGIKITRPTGGFVVWIELPSGIDSFILHQKALQARIGIVPGPIFSAKRKYRNFIRLSCGHPWSEKLESSVKKLGQIIREMM